MAEFTLDTFLHEHLNIVQNKKGYRFSIDAVILAAHVGRYTTGLTIDLGTGCGIIPMIMAFRNPELKIIGVELQKGLADLALMNVQKNNLNDRITILYQDLKGLTQKMIGGPVDIIISNPPYHKVISGRLNPNSERASARHEIFATLDDIAACAGRMLRTCGKFVAIYPAERLTDMISALKSYQIEPKSLRTIHSYVDSDAKLVLVEGSKRGQPGIKISPPLILYQKNGQYTAEVEQMFKPY